jgi:hypothetical protein
MSDNTRSGGGPKSEAGKRLACKNAIKHGYFSKEVNLVGSDVSDFEALKKSLQKQFDPKTTTQAIALERIIYSAWRLKLAARREMKSFKLGEAEGAETSSELPEPKPEVLRWSKWGRRELAEAIKCTRSLRADIEESGWVHSEDWRGPLTRMFGGPEFHDMLTQFSPKNIDSVLLQEYLSAHAATFKMPLPKQDSNLGTADPEVGRVQWNCLLAIVDLKLTALEDLRLFLDTRDQGRDEEINTMECSGRFFTTASRDLERAVQWFQELREQGL